MNVWFIPFWVLVLSPENAELNYKTLLVGFYVPLHFHHICHHRPIPSKEVSHAWNKLRLPLKYPSALFAFQMKFKWYILSAIISLKYNPTEVSHKSGHVVCYCVTWTFFSYSLPSTTGIRVCSPWWHIPEPKPILFCCHETSPQQSINRESETMVTDLNSN